MNLLGKESSKDLNLDSDLSLSARDIKILAHKDLDHGRDLGTYLDFLEEIGAFESRKTAPKIFKEVFVL